MKALYINELAEGARVDGAFALRAKELRSARSGEPYLAVQLADRTGHMSAVLFRPNGSATAVPAGSVVHAVGRVSTYRGTKRMVLDSLEPAGTYNASDLMAEGPRSRDELLAELRAVVSGVRDAGLGSLLRSVFGQPEFLERFLACPAAQSYHHAYIGGLAEHTLAVARLCRSVTVSYPEVDADLLVTAALLHDIGKVDELSWSASIEYTDEGRLLGHVVLGVRRLQQVADRVKARVGQGRLTRLEHAILSHHGELEWGSPKRPSTLEALLLHHVDNLDAKAAGFTALSSAAVRTDEVWTDATNLFRRPLYAPRPAADDREVEACEDESCLRSA